MLKCPPAGRDPNEATPNLSATTRESSGIFRSLPVSSLMACLCSLIDRKSVPCSVLVTVGASVLGQCGWYQMNYRVLVLACHSFRHCFRAFQFPSRSGDTMPVPTSWEGQLPTQQADWFRLPDIRWARWRSVSPSGAHPWLETTGVAGGQGDQTETQ